MFVIPKLQIVREARNLQLTDQLRIFRVGKINRKKRVHIPVCHKVTDIIHKPRRVNRLSVRYVLNFSMNFHLIV